MVDLSKGRRKGCSESRIFTVGGLSQKAEGGREGVAREREGDRRRTNCCIDRHMRGKGEKERQGGRYKFLIREAGKRRRALSYKVENNVKAVCFSLGYNQNWGKGTQSGQRFGAGSPLPCAGAATKTLQ